jgi:hypothetical protein
MTFQPDLPDQPEPPSFGSTCTCGDWQADGVTHRIGEPCTVDETGDEYLAPPQVEERAGSEAGDDTDSDVLAPSLDDDTAGLRWADDTPNGTQP